MNIAEVDKSARRHYTYTMPNLADANEAMRSGELDTAYDILKELLNSEPDNSELWWAVMLCKFGWKDETELAAAVKSKFYAAAHSGAAPPLTPFETSYCKNALAYATDDRREKFIRALKDELNEIWKSARGESLFELAEPKKRGKLTSAVPIYIVTAVALVFAVVAAAGIFASSAVVQWIGAAGFTLSAAAALALAFAVGRGGAKLAVALAVFIISCAALAAFVAGFITDDLPVVITSASVLAAVALYGTVSVMLSYRDPQTKKTDKNARDGGTQTDEDADMSHTK